MCSFSIASAGNSQRTSIFAVAFTLLVHGGITGESFVNVQRPDFQADFVFGVATSAAQIEGSSKSEGKGPGVWDQFERRFSWKIADNSSLDVSIDSYKRYKEDALILKDQGVGAFRFSIPWTRILPNRTLSDGINEEGINH
ncbi:cyanogenic beta-glucosidase-like [Hibiscus syriacus]|uniref:cyanogenic beta-glucosidase-like n=1 Tax=Hibiscus syriacus TaxID=106335 RepID=UPI001923F1DF|nr:cyanogenic beta-glucosidase-like [Hibiscus syriacus]